MKHRWGHLGAALGLVASVLAIACAAAATLPPVVKIGAIFTEEEKNGPNELAFKYAIHKINKDKTLLPYTSLVYDIQYVPRDDSFHASKKACQLVHYGVHAIFGPSDPLLGAHIHSICDALDIPHLEARLDIESDVREFSINLHPTQVLLNAAFQDVMSFLNWTRIAIIYEKDYGLLKLRELVRSPHNGGLEIYLRQANPDSYQDVLMEIKSKEIYNIVIDTKPLNLQHFLKGILQLQMNDYKYHYLFTTFDMEAFDLEDFKYNFVNITAFRIVDTDNLSVKETIRNMFKFQPNKDRFMNSTFIQVDTNSKYSEHIFRCNFSKPTSVLYLCKDTKKLICCDLKLCCKEFILSQQEIKIPPIPNIAPFSFAMFTPDNVLFVIDFKGNIYSVDTEFTLERLIELNEEGNVLPSIMWHKSSVVTFGPDNHLRSYSKKNNVWTLDWKAKSKVDIIKMCSVSGLLIGADNNGELLRINEDGSVNHYKGTSRRFSDFCLIAPLGEYFVTVRKMVFINLFSVETGKEISRLKLDHPATAINANPVYPYFALSCKSGYVNLFSVYKPEKLTQMCSLYLSTNPIQKISFFEKGQIFVTCYLDNGEFFIVEGLPGTQLNVLAHIEVNRQIVDFTLIASKGCYRLFVLPVASQYYAGNEIIRYCVVNGETINVKRYFMESKDMLYTAIISSLKPNRDRVFYGIPLKSRNIHELETKRGDSVVRVIGEIPSGHLICGFHLKRIEYFLFTWGHDGSIFVRDFNFEEVLAAVRVHHRYDLGVKKAYINCSASYVLSLGYDNVLCCTKINDVKKDPYVIDQLLSLVESDKFALMFKRPTLGFAHDEKSTKKTWIQIHDINKTEKERVICAEERSNIMKQFEGIKIALTELVTKNLEGPTIEKIDLIEFYLDQFNIQQKKVENREQCKKLQTKLKALIEAQKLVTNHLIKTYHEPMDVKGKVIRGFFEKTIATIYTLLPPNEEDLRKLALTEEQRKVEEIMSLNCIFQPWLPLTHEELQNVLSFRAKFTHLDYSTLTSKAMLEEATSTLSLESQIALVGAITQQFFERNPWHYKQRQLVSFYQCDLQQTMTDNEIIKLKKHYNVTFNNMAELKIREMDNIKERHNRLRYIIQEYNYFSDSKINFEIEDPEWTHEEDMNLILTVSDEELGIVPYVSPSEQALLDAKAIEEEKMRQKMLADDFRERALYQMMSGVLEVKWEDELKKEIPLPKCMIEKRPNEYTDEDKRNIKEYEEKVIFLNSERERYKNMLEVDFNKISIYLRDSIRKFNQKLKDTVEYNMLVESAINQERLTVLKTRLVQNEKNKLYKKENKLKVKIEDNEAQIQELQETIKHLNEVLTECKSNFEVIQAKEKVLEKSFKRELQEFSTPVQEQALKIYRRRPKWNVKQSFTTISILLEVARCVINQEMSLVLTNECIDYLKALNHLDEYVGIPPVIDESTFKTICKHRRIRIEIEFKIKAGQLQLSDGETVIASYQKRYASRKERHIKLVAELKKCRETYLYLVHNIPVQIVLRKGLVEIPLSGDMTTDFKDAILVPKHEIILINQLINKAGNNKLKTIRQNMAFRRKIIVTEWDHKRLRMIINDLIEQINDINAAKLLKDMQAEPALIYDSVYVFAIGLQTLEQSHTLKLSNLSCDKEQPWDGGLSLINYINSVEMKGLSGPIEFKEGRRIQFKLDLLKLKQPSLVKVGEWRPGVGVNITDRAAFFDPGTMNVTLVVTTILEIPYVMMHTAKNYTGNSRFYGFCIDILDRISQEVGFDYLLDLVPDRKYGARDPNTGLWNGMVLQLMQHKADLAVGSMTINYARESVIDFTKPFMNLGISILFKVPSSRQAKLFSFMNPLATHIWLYVLSAYVLVSITMFVVARFSPCEWQNPHPCVIDNELVKNQFSLANSFWFTIGTLMQQGSDLNPKATSTRIVGGIWWFFTLIIISSYTANLAAFLTVERMITPIENAEDLAGQTEIPYGTLESGSTMTFFRDSMIETYKKMWRFMENRKPSVFVPTYEEGIQKVLDGNYAFLMESTMLDYIVQRNCNLTQIGGPLDSKGYGIATPKGSPWRDRISLAILELQEKGEIQMLYDKWWKNSGDTCQRNDKGKESKANSLGVDNIGGVFVVLLCGLAFAVIIAIFEFCYNSKKNALNEKRSVSVPHQSLCSEMKSEFCFALRCGGSRQRPALRRKCSKCLSGVSYVPAMLDIPPHPPQPPMRAPPRNRVSPQMDTLHRRQGREFIFENS